MKQEKSCGVIAFTRTESGIRYVLAQSRAGHYGFPKGHTEPGETEEETALREVFEEVHLRPTLIEGFREVSEYGIPSLGVRKQVVLFLGSYEAQEIVPQDSELLRAAAVSYDDAMLLLTHEDTRNILTKAELFLQNLGKDGIHVQ